MHKPNVFEILEDRTLLADGINPAAGSNISATAGVAINNDIVATYTIANSQGSPGTKWRAKVDWGDGTGPDKRVNPTSAAGGVFEFLDSHTYASTGTFTVTVQISVPGSHKPNDNTVKLTAVVASAATLQTISVAPTNPSVPDGLTEPFAATGHLSDGSTENLTTQVTWASSATSVATISNATGSNGLATAVSQGTSTITATLSGISGSTVMTVSAPVLQSIVVAPANPNVPKGETEQFHATGTFSDHSTSDISSQVNWTSSATAIATISNTTGTQGLATAVALGSSTITATLNGINGTTSINVTSPVLASISVSPATPSVPKGETEQFHATGTFSDSSTQDLTNQVTWASATPAVATISNTSGSKGLATAVALGTSQITATMGTINGSTVMTVAAPVLASIAVSPSNPSVPQGSPEQFSALGTFSDNSTGDVTSQVTWASSDQTVATISNSAGSQGLATTLKVGTTSITATSGAISASTVLTVTAALVSITIAPESPSVPKGETEQFTATGQPL